MPRVGVVMRVGVIWIGEESGDEEEKKKRKEA